MTTTSRTSNIVIFIATLTYPVLTHIRIGIDHIIQTGAGAAQ